MKIKIGSRTSELAIKQTEAVIARLKEEFPEDVFEITGITTRGDREREKKLSSFGGKGIFIKEIESALISGEIDMAVHSAKDMPVEIADGLEIGAALLRADRRDVLVYFGEEKNIKTIGTGSARRQTQAEKLFPNARFKQIRGNIHTRIEKVRNGEYDAVIMAKAAIDRLGITDIEIMDLGDSFVCAAGQGILAVETVKGKMKKYTAAINDKAVMAELMAERAFLSAVGGGCSAPCGASAVYDKGKLKMNVFYSDGGDGVYYEMTDTDPDRLGRLLADKVKGI